MVKSASKKLNFSRIAESQCAKDRKSATLVVQLDPQSFGGCIAVNTRHAELKRDGFYPSK